MSNKDPYFQSLLYKVINVGLIILLLSSFVMLLLSFVVLGVKVYTNLESEPVNITLIECSQWCLDSTQDASEEKTDGTTE